MTSVPRIERVAVAEQLPELLAFVEAACAAADLPPDIAFAVRLATEEACTNVITHGYAGMAPGPVSIDIASTAERVVVTIADRARRFDVGDVPAPRLEGDASDRKLGGLGCHLIRQMMDEVHHQYDAAAGNVLTLVKHIPPHRIQ